MTIDELNGNGQTPATDDLRILQVRPLISPAILIEEIPQTDAGKRLVSQTRRSVEDVLYRRDPRLVAVVGPCSIHDADEALDYARRLKEVADAAQDALIVIMRAYFEKPRTVGGWKGLINDPSLDETYQINRGLRLARTLLSQITEIGLPVGTEFLDNVIPQFISDQISWVAIGARTTESQIHRQFASGCSMPVGFKNATNGDSSVAIDAVRAARLQHWFPSVTKQGVSAIMQTAGNSGCHVILRGGKQTGPNYNPEAVADVAAKLREQGLPDRVMIDCSHGNSNKDHLRQAAVAREVIHQVAGGSPHVLGIMLESNLVEGRQDFEVGQPLTYGQSITDACMGFDNTREVLAELADAVRARNAG